MTLKIKNYSFSELPFSELFRTYVTDFPNLQSFYSANPFDIHSVESHARAVENMDSDKETALLREYNRPFDPGDTVMQNIEWLADKRALAIVTGQQLGMFGGPVFTALKIVAVIHLARSLENWLGLPVVPVFWLADEDHDFDEINSVSLIDNGGFRSLEWEGDGNTHLPVSEIELSDSFETFRNQVKDALPETDFSSSLWELIDNCYRPGARMDDAYGNLIARLFSKYGLVLAGSNRKDIKGTYKTLMKKAVSNGEKIHDLLEEQSVNIEKNFHRQAVVHDSNLFYLDGEEGRLKISRNGESWKTDTGLSWTTDELLESIEKNPERFSPNVFLRPLLQDSLLPTIGYVAGPGELAYYAQMKDMYRFFNCPMPIIFPRLSATFIEPAIDRIMEELPFKIVDYNDRIEDLESTYIERADQYDIEQIFREWKEQIERIAEANSEEVVKIDPTLEGAAGKATSIYAGELDKLKGKVYRSVKQQEETQLNRIRKIKTNLFPDGTLQERSLSFIYFMNKYGLDIWDRLLEELDEEEDFSHHKLIYL